MVGPSRLPQSSGPRVEPCGVRQSKHRPAYIKERYVYQVVSTCPPTYCRLETYYPEVLLAPKRSRAKNATSHERMDATTDTCKGEKFYFRRSQGSISNKVGELIFKLYVIRSESIFHPKSSSVLIVKGKVSRPIERPRKESETPSPHAN